MINIWLVVSNIAFMFHFIYGMSSETHWLSLHHFSRWAQPAPPTRWLMFFKNGEKRNPWTGNFFEPVWRDDVGGFWRQRIKGRGPIEIEVLRVFFSLDSGHAKETAWASVNGFWWKNIELCWRVKINLLDAHFESLVGGLEHVLFFLVI